MGRLMRSLLIAGAPALWLAAAALGLAHSWMLFPVTGMALAGTLCGQLREREDGKLAEAARELAAAMRQQPGRTQPPLRQVR